MQREQDKEMEEVVPWERGGPRVTPERLAGAAVQRVVPFPELETATVGRGLWQGREW